MVHIQDLIENSDPCLSIISKQCSFTSDPSTLLESSIHPDMRIQCNLLSLFLLGLVVTSMVEASRRKRHKKKKGKKVKQEKQTIPLPPPSLMMTQQGQKMKFLFLKLPLGNLGKGATMTMVQLSKTSNHLFFSIDDPYGSLPSLLSQVSTTSDLSFLNPSLGTGFVSSFSTLKLESSKQNDGKINIDTIHSSSSPSSSLSSASESNVAQDVIDALEENGFESIKRDWRKWEHRKDLFDHVVMKSVEFIIGFINQVEKLKRPTLAALFIKRSDDS